MTLAILVVGRCFLTMPLRCTFPLPQPAGWTGAIFRTLHSFDRPYNLFPSLHISIWMILSGVYHRHTAGHVRWLTHAWFILIAVSTVLTHQHHVIDVAGGLVLGLFCYYLVPEDLRSQPRTRLTLVSEHSTFAAPHSLQRQAYGLDPGEGCSCGLLRQ